MPNATVSTFPNGQALSSSAFTPDTIAALFQPLIAQILGFDPGANPTTAYSAVRTAWPASGQPAWAITDDVCCIQATAEDEPYSQVRDEFYVNGSSGTVSRQMAFTQVWLIHLSLYGPNGYDHARLISSAMSLDWVHDSLAGSSIYAIPEWQRPAYAPELFQGQWWKRTDLQLKFNEQVTESIAVDSAAGVDVTLLTDTGQTSEFTISAQKGV